MKRLLVLVDLQNDFVNGVLAAEGAMEAVEHAKALLLSEVQRGSDVVYTADWHGEDYLSTPEGKKLPVPHCIAGTRGAEFYDGVYRTGARVFRKDTFSSRELAEAVKEGGYGEVVLAGICTDICVVSNALLIKAYCPEAAVSVKKDACAGTTRKNHEAALQVMACCQIDVE